MNYRFYLERQLKLYGITVLVTMITYSIGCYMGWREQLMLTQTIIGIWLSGSLTFIFLGAYVAALMNPLNK